MAVFLFVWLLHARYNDIFENKAWEIHPTVGPWVIGNFHQLVPETQIVIGYIHLFMRNIILLRIYLAYNKSNIITCNEFRNLQFQLVSIHGLIAIIKIIFILKGNGILYSGFLKTSEITKCN